jgi:hypothetical protein
VEVLEGHFKPSVLATHVVTLARKYGLHRISVEDSPGAILMQAAVSNYALTTGWDVWIDWQDFNDDTGQRDLRIRNIEADLSTGRLFFNADMKHLKPLMLEFSQYGMLPDSAIPDCVARVADALLPQSIAADFDEDDDAWRAAQERDRYNCLYGRGQYARPEPEPEEVEVMEERMEDRTVNELGMAIIMPGLE